MRPISNLLVDTFRVPGRVALFTPSQWDLLIRLARRSNLLSRLAFLLSGEGLLEQIPKAPMAHLKSAILTAEQQHRAAHWEIECIQLALAHLEAPVVLLKGAAYLAAGLPLSQGRIFSDIDILVPKQSVAEAESCLIEHGWVGANPDDAYYQKYYRDWMHEIPPMQHRTRGTTLDLHHSILPETARTRFSAHPLFSRIKPVHGVAGSFVLSPEDMVLHSATHLFHEGELGNGLRDLLDIKGLLEYFSQRDSRFWEVLIHRAAELRLNRQLWYALRYVNLILGASIPDSTKGLAGYGKPDCCTIFLMDFCYLRALQPDHASCNTQATWLARSFVYFRSHWLKMPVPLLVYHLGRKFLQGLFNRDIQ